MLKLTVGKNGTENYGSIQEALEAVPYNQKAEIIISEGRYREKLYSDKKDLTIRGVGKVEIDFSDHARQIMDDGRKRGTFRSYTAFFSGGRLLLENLTISNSSGRAETAGQALALYLDCAKARLENVRLVGNQDTLFISPLPDEEMEVRGFYGPRCFTLRSMCEAVFHSCHIEGSVDFIFGSGNALFEYCTIHSVEKGFVAAPSGRKDGIGFIFKDCVFSSGGCADESVFLMRPWRKEGKAAFVNCSFGAHINRRGYTYFRDGKEDMENSTFLLSNCTFSIPPEMEESHFVRPEVFHDALDHFRKL